MSQADVAIIGGGIIGLATANSLLRARPGLRVHVIEKEARPAVHQSGRNSGVIHSGVYYRRGSVKARTVAAGRTALIEFCRLNDIAFDICGKVIVAVDDAERLGLHELEQRARDSGVRAEIISPSRLAELEPYAVGVAALHVPSAGITDYGEVCDALGRQIVAAGGEIQLSSEVLGLVERDAFAVVQLKGGDIEAQAVLNCAGLYSDRLLAQKGSSRRFRIVPFRGEYRNLVDDRTHLVRSLIYPVPDRRFPFLGPHLTRSIGGEVHAGPNAVLALSREGYSWGDVDIADTWDLLRFSGFRRLAALHWRPGAAEVYRSLSERAFLRSIRRLLPQLSAEDFVPGTSGVRAQAVDADGRLVDDFLIHETPRVVHVVNAPSPAATASLEIGRIVADLGLGRL